MRARRHACRRFVRRQKSAERETAAKPLGDGHDIRLDPRPFIGEKLAGASDAGLHFVENEQKPVLIRQFAQGAQEGPARMPHAAFALHRFDQDGAGLGADRRARRIQVAERHLVEAVDLRAEAGQVLLLVARRDGRQRAPVEAAFEGDDPVAFRMAVMAMEFARGLDRAFQRLGAGIAEENLVGEGRGAKARGEPLLAGDIIEVRCVPELAGLLAQGADQMRVRMTEHRHGHARAEIQISLAAQCIESGSLASVEGNIGSGVCGQHRGHGQISSLLSGKKAAQRR